MKTFAVYFMVSMGYIAAREASRKMFNVPALIPWLTVGWFLCSTIILRFAIIALIDKFKRTKVTKVV